MERQNHQVDYSQRVIHQSIGATYSAISGGYRSSERTCNPDLPGRSVQKQLLGGSNTPESPACLLSYRDPCLPSSALCHLSVGQNSQPCKNVSTSKAQSVKQDSVVLFCFVLFFVFKSIYVVYRFACIEPSLHFRNKTNLIIVYTLCDTCLHSICKVFY